MKKRFDNDYIMLVLIGNEERKGGGATDYGWRGKENSVWLPAGTGITQQPQDFAEYIVTFLVSACLKLC
jgi:hypothetical protein